jgi:hypothetical protein
MLVELVRSLMLCWRHHDRLLVWAGRASDDKTKGCFGCCHSITNNSRSPSASSLVACLGDTAELGWCN